MKKQLEIQDIFNNFSSAEKKYEKIIEMGRALPPLSPTAKVPSNLVPGCQSLLYLETSFKEGLLYFNADSDALISKGLAALLIHVYSGEPPETLLKQPPLFLKEIGLDRALSPARSNGLASLYKKMQQEALNSLCYLESKISPS
jgi:cysteine desulfuration protein SufE